MCGDLYVGDGDEGRDNYLGMELARESYCVVYNVTIHEFTLGDLLVVFIGQIEFIQKLNDFKVFFIHCY